MTETAGNQEPRCPKCGTRMGVETSPDAGTLWCGSIECWHSIGRDSPIEDVRAYLAANGIETKPAIEAVLRAVMAKSREQA